MLSIFALPGLVLAQDGESASRIADPASVANLPAADQQLLTSEIPEMEGDDEFGDVVVIERVANWMPWSLSGYSGYVRTDNATLADEGTEVNDAYWRSGARVGWLPSIKGNLFANVGLTQEFFRYDDFTDLDFEYMVATAGLFYTPQKNGTWLDLITQDLAMFANYNYYRITENDLADELFTNHSISAGLQKNTPIKRGHRIYYGVVVEPSLDATPTTGKRGEYRWFGGYIVEWTPKLSSTLLYTGSVFDYELDGREDVNHYLSLSQMITLWQGFQGSVAWNSYVNLELAYALNDSNAEFRDYENLTWGATLGMRVVF